MSRNPNYTGSANRDRTAGGWKGRVIVDGQAYWARGRTKKEVLDKHKAKVAELARLAELATVTDLDPDILLGDWLSIWLDNLALRVDLGEVKGTYYSACEYQVRCQIRPVLGRVKAKDLRAEHVRMLHRDGFSRGLGASTVAQAHRTLRAAIQPLINEHGLLRVSPTRLVTEPAVHRSERPPAYTTAEIQILTAAAPALDDLAMTPARVMVAAWMGLREGEACALKVDDINLARQELRVLRSLSRQPWRHGTDCVDKEGHKASACSHRTRGALTGSTKSAAGYRTLPIPDIVLPFLRQQICLVAEARLAASGAWPAEQWLFPDPVDGRRQSIHSDRRRWVRLVKLALGDHAGTGTHAARRHAATRLAEAGVPVAVAMKTWAGREQNSRTCTAGYRTRCPAPNSTAPSKALSRSRNWISRP